MGFVNLKEMAKRLKRTEEEVMAYVESGIITTESYAHPCHFGDGREIAFYPEKVLAQIEAKKKVKEPEPEQKEEPEPEKTTEEELPPEQPSEQTEDEGKDPFEEAKKEEPKKGKKEK